MKTLVRVSVENLVTKSSSRRVVLLDISRYFMVIDLGWLLDDIVLKTPTLDPFT